MIDFIVGVVGFVAKMIALVVAFAFWFTIGFFIWTRHVVVSFILLTARITVVPLAEPREGEDPPESTASQRFDAALRLWPEGFNRIIRAIRGSPKPGPTPPADGFWRNLFRYAWEGLAALLFWAPIIFIVHHTGVWRIGVIDSIERSVVDMQDGEKEDGSAPQSEPTCLGEGAVIAVDPAQDYVAKQKVDVRRGPGTNHEKLGELPGGQRVSVIARAPGGEWALVTVDGETRCFVATRYLEPAN